MCIEIENYNIKNNLSSMEEYNIIKLIDGLFIGDILIPTDSHFLIGNKIIRMLGWTNQTQSYQMQEEGVLEYRLSKNLNDVKFPLFQQLLKAFKFFEDIHDEMLCGLIYSQSELQASLIGIMYLMYHYHWSFDTAFSFVKSKMNIFQFSDQAIDQLQAYERELEGYLGKKLNHICWDWSFLINYRPNTDEEALIVNTIKNRLKNCDIQCSEVRQKKKQRIRWYDQMRPASALTIHPNKNFQRTSLTKNRLIAASIQSQQELNMNFNNTQLFQSVTIKNLNMGVANMNNSRVLRQKKVDRIERQNVWQDQQYLQLKEMSRTNFNDRKYMSSKIRRKGSLKPNKTVSQKSQSQGNLNVQNINTIVGIYSSFNGKQISTKNSMSKVGTVQSFLSSLRSYNKVSLGNA